MIKPGLRLLLSYACLSALLAACAPEPAAGLAEEESEGNDCDYCSNPARKFAGVWEPIAGSPDDAESGSEPALSPQAQQSIKRQIKLRNAGNISYDYSAVCIPPASPTMTTFSPQEILVDGKKMTWIIEATAGIRSIWLDGREHPPREELRRTAYGHSTAQWDGDVLVIDSVGFLDKAMVYVNIRGNVSIYPSPQMHFVERLRLVDGGEAIISERTLYDPVNLAEPWETTVRYERRDWEIGETICMENNKVFHYFEDREDIPGYAEEARNLTGY